MVLDELIAKLSNTSSGGTIASGTRIAALEFADDIVLMEDQDEAIALSLMECSRFFNARGMSLNSAKSAAIFAASIKGVSVPKTKSLFKIQGEPVKTITDALTFRYLVYLVVRPPSKQVVFSFY